ncbi:MAG: phage terminase small subunit P27 family [Lachnospiraceae bacterium]|nr:phage terminase small subunit P27 family [Lachnospiraceae bacterium]
MARPRKQLETQTGNLTRQTQTIRSYEESLIRSNRDAIEQIPPSLFRNAAAKKEYKRILPELLDNNVIGNMDRNNIVVYCNSWSEYQQYQKELKKEDAFLESKDGKLYENPKIRMMRDAFRQMTAAGEKLGMSISSRLSAAALKARQQEETLKNEFGDI